MAKKKLDPNRPRRWQTLIARIPQDEPVVGVEVGVWVGDTAKRVLEARPLATHYMVDAWTKPAEDSTYVKTPDTIAKREQKYFDECYEKTVAAVSKYGERAVIIREWSWDAVKRFEDGSLDFAFIDSDHSYEGVLGEIKRWLPKVKTTGFIGGHDFGNLPRFPGVELAVREVFGDDIEIDGDCTWYHWIGGAV